MRAPYCPRRQKLLYYFIDASFTRFLDTSDLFHRLELLITSLTLPPIMAHVSLVPRHSIIYYSSIDFLILAHTRAPVILTVELRTNFDMNSPFQAQSRLPGEPRWFQMSIKSKNTPQTSRRSSSKAKITGDCIYQHSY